MKLIYLLIGFLMLAALPTATAQEEKDWTLLVYIVGSDLESGSDAASTDIAEMIAGATYTDYVNVVLLTGGANKPGWETPRSFLIADGQQTELDFQPTSEDMANPDNVVEFINWGIANYPAQSYMLDFWNHGGELRGYGWVDGTEDHLSINQIQQSIGQSTFITEGNKFDVIGFDACLMASLEVQSMLKDYAYFYVGSEETEPGHGWNYKPIIEAMESGEALYGDEIGTIIVDSYQQHAIDEETWSTGVTLSLTDLGQISNLETKLQLLLDKIGTEDKEDALQRSVSATEEYGKSAQVPATSSDVVDLGDLLKHIKNFDSSLDAEATEVMTALDSTVIHSINDSGRPKASGMTVYFPHNVLSSEGELEYVINDVYTPLNIATPLKNFILDDYIPFITSDDSAPGGFMMSESPSSFLGGPTTGGVVTTIILTIEHDSDIEHVQIVLDEEFTGNPGEYILLGSTFPDSIANVDENTDEYYYFWDEQWLGLNGHPAYISDIHDYELEDENGEITKFHRIHIPAILNNETPDEKNIMINFRFDEEYNITLEGIMHEHNGEGASRVVPKERIKLQAGDEIQLLYEIFNEVTDEEFFYEKPGAVITIENGNEDLQLEYDQLEDGNYKIGFAILDHSHNDTLVFDDEVFQVISNATIENFSDNNIQMYPNPADQGFNVVCPDQLETTFVLTLTDASGKTILTTELAQSIFIETKNIPNGIYTVSLSADGKTFIDQVVIQH
ncbi:MAG: clostripain-related cysteine peptidase [Lewinella sp.]|jgi:hypothetical protein|uniref:clostripain-related cysteine peptidase n=1 Tax=Lewinella sp. TaxID=2004506 RepID=UPI003D6C34B6